MAAAGYFVAIDVGSSSGRASNSAGARALLALGLTHPLAQDLHEAERHLGVFGQK